jgi:hypothetical protein
MSWTNGVITALTPCWACKRHYIMDRAWPCCPATWEKQTPGYVD